MQAPYLKSVLTEALLDPKEARWKEIGEEKIALTGTPVAQQPSAYIRSKWENQKPGKISEVGIKAMHNGDMLAFHLTWRVPADKLLSSKRSEFPDAAAVAFDVGGTPPGNNPSFHTMGSPGCPLTIWHWQAGSEQAGREVGAEGVGTTEEFTNGTVKASGVFSTDSWQVVIARHLNKAGDKTKDPFRMGEEINFAVAIWDGSSNERAGLKAVSARPVRINISDKNHAETRG